MLRKKYPMTRPGIDPRAFRLVAQRLNHYANPGPRILHVADILQINLFDIFDNLFDIYIYGEFSVSYCDGYFDLDKGPGRPLYSLLINIYFVRI